MTVVLYLASGLPVPDHASRISDVVLVRSIFSPGNPRESGIWDGEGMGRGWKWGDQFTSNLGPRLTGSYHAKEGFQVSKREWKGSKRESARGSKEQGDRAIIIVPDRRLQIVPEVVLVRRWIIGVLGIWRGEGLGKGLGQGRSVYKQPETEVDGSCHS